MVVGKLMNSEELKIEIKKEQRRRWQKNYYDTPKGREACLKAQSKYQKYRKIINQHKSVPEVPCSISGIVVFD